MKVCVLRKLSVTNSGKLLTDVLPRLKLMIYDIFNCNWVVTRWQ